MAIIDKDQCYDYLLYLAKRGQSFHYIITQRKETWEHFLEEFPLEEVIDVIVPLLLIGSNIKALITLTEMTSSKYQCS